MLTSSKKAKGKVVCKEVKQLLHKYAPLLQDGDIHITPSGVPGVDIYLSPEALKTYPFAIECKNQESLNIWKALEQAQSHAEGTSLTPLLFFRRNHTELFVTLKAEDLFRLIQK